MIEVDQRKLWNNQHAKRGGPGGIESALCDSPCEAAILLMSVLNPNSHILEVGPGLGRDARTWAAAGHRVDCIEISDVALQQLTGLAARDGLQDKFKTYCHDISAGTLPDGLGGNFDAFYARSALPLRDEELIQLSGNITLIMKRDGIILIEGKGPCDYKINRSDDMGGGLRRDIDGHIRRVWDDPSMRKLAKINGWGIIRVEEYTDDGPYGCNQMIRLVAKKL